MQEMNVAMSSHPFIIYFYILLPALHLVWGFKPEIGAFPSKVVKKGDSVTIRCSSPYWGTFRLYRINTDYSDSKTINVNEYDFTVTDVQEDNSAYSCVQYSRNWQSEWSDRLSLQVIDPHKPNISCLQNDPEDTERLITCRAPDPPEGCRVKRFFLHSGRMKLGDLPVKGSSPQVTFIVSNLIEYRCSYVLEVKEQPRQLIESPLSDKVTSAGCIGVKPEIRAFPSKVVKKGDSVTIRCSFPYYQGRFLLQRTNTDESESKVTDVNEYNFTVTDVQEDNSAYRCLQYSGSWWSDWSDLLSLQVIDPHKPNISCLQDDPEDSQRLITCRAPDPPEGCRVKRFFLHSGRMNLRDLSVKGSSPQVTFVVSNLIEYRCSYVLEVKEQPRQLIESPLSDKVTSAGCIDLWIIADYTTANRIRLVLAGVLIILACGFVIEYWISSIKDLQSVI